MHFLYEADGLAGEGKFDMAYSTYEMQIVSLRTQPDGKLDIKLLAITHGRLGKMFLLQSKFDRAIVEFGRQLSLADEVDDKPEAADAYFGMGTGYVEIRDYDNAIRYLSIAQTRLASLGNMPKYCGCMRKLREVYERLGQMEPVKMYDEKIFRIEGELRYKLDTIGRKLSDLSNRLNNTNAEIEHMVTIERTSLKAIEYVSHVCVCLCLCVSLPTACSFSRPTNTNTHLLPLPLGLPLCLPLPQIQEPDPRDARRARRGGGAGGQAERRGGRAEGPAHAHPGRNG